MEFHLTYHEQFLLLKRDYSYSNFYEVEGVRAKSNLITPIERASHFPQVTVAEQQAHYIKLPLQIKITQARFCSSIDNAFDTVWHKGFPLPRFTEYNCPPYLQNFYTHISPIECLSYSRNWPLLLRPIRVRIRSFLEVLS